MEILHASTEGEIDAAFASLAKSRTGALLVSSDVFFNGRITQLIALAAQHAVPTAYNVPEFALAGGLMCYGNGLADGYRPTGLQVAPILKGKNPANLPLIQTAKLELVINLKTAKALGITVPPSLLARADEVIE
jgi:ABC-type uncharacterized transport system substrate-binding protein